MGSRYIQTPLSSADMIKFISAAFEASKGQPMTFHAEAKLLRVEWWDR